MTAGRSVSPRGGGSASDMGKASEVSKTPPHGALQYVHGHELRYHDLGVLKCTTWLPSAFGLTQQVTSLKALAACVLSCSGIFYGGTQRLECSSSFGQYITILKKK